MKVLGIESSTEICSVAIIENINLIGEFKVNVPKAHSIYLMPMIDSLLRNTGNQLEDIGLIAISGGPGSFTGLRIGFSVGEALAYGMNIPIVTIPSLVALRENGKGQSGLALPLIYAKKNEAYSYLVDGEKIILDEGARSLDDIISICKDLKKPILPLGDGKIKYFDIFKKSGLEIVEINEDNYLPKGSTIAFLGLKKYSEFGGEDIFTLKPKYLKKTQAEIDLEDKINGKS